MNNEIYIRGHKFLESWDDGIKVCRFVEQGDVEVPIVEETKPGQFSSYENSKRYLIGIIELAIMTIDKSDKMVKKK